MGGGIGNDTGNGMFLGWAGGVGEGWRVGEGGRGVMVLHQQQSEIVPL